MWVLEPMEIPEIGDKILSNVELKDLLRLRRVNQTSKKIADTRLRSLYTSIYKTNPGDMEMKKVISKLKKVVGKEMWVFLNGLDEDFSNYYIFYGTKRKAMEQWAMISVLNNTIDTESYTGPPERIKTLRDYVLALYKTDMFTLETDEIPIKDSTIERFMTEMTESIDIMKMSDFLEEELWPQVRSVDEVFRIDTSVRFGYDIEVDNIDITNVSREDYMDINRVENDAYGTTRYYSNGELHREGDLPRPSRPLVERAPWLPPQHATYTVYSAARLAELSDGQIEAKSIG